ncbi:UDP-glucose 4-epimerase family protein [Vibrio gallaecicus]|uniref:UDP-glucose 4-epimerase family protein n=1 Tax=Vibrio gallaecicus TaxID=552386 RepID=UPI0010C9DF16|nr:SDR family oxidoreductase [Vibrio gallaecicus]MDN3614830.1 SDR family oxidoreductase [Vibrio gallaecicus]
MNRTLITGYSGFVGGHLLNALGSLENVNLLGRTTPPKCRRYLKASIEPNSNYSSVLQDVDVVVHIAARVHVMSDTTENPLEEFRLVNTAGTLNLARQAVESGVKRFVFVSSIKVNGESTTDKPAFNATDKPNPEDPYGISKAEAEKQLLALGDETGMEVVIIRPPLVYGKGVKGNFASLMGLVDKGVPLPFGLINENKRSLVSVYNLVDLIKVCIDHPKAVGQVFLVSDGHDVSTTQMVYQMANALGKSNWQLPIPIWCYSLAGKLFNKALIVDRLTGSLQVDITHTKNTLDWTPPQTLNVGFKETANSFQKSQKNGSDI